ncbi:MAG: hypothetical protein CVU44_10830 [Chloroflexi bacterium HGW-Chloroflexi-6]|nr:MAG: hypothetical protein CVU44_10830 [Chloroflexi bacterium HGW-Chloroflexi-6]
MPAIDIARLKIQAASLVEKFDRPAAFLHDLHEILDLYADRTLRVSVAAPASVLRSYRAPQSVLKQIEFELAPLTATFPEQSMALTDALWRDAHLETRLLAATLLGRIDPRTPLLLERISAWVGQVRDKKVRAALLTTSLHRLRRETPDQFLKLTQEWLASEDSKMWANGIEALIPLLDDPGFENLPPVFDIVRPAIASAPASLQKELAALVNALYRASSVETVFFIKQIIIASQNPQALTIIRRIMPELDKEIQPHVQKALRDKSG